MEEVKLPEPDTASLAYSGHSMDYISGYEAGFESAADQMREAILAERARCITACQGEKLEDPTEHEGDIAYDKAIEHCIEAIRKG